MEAEKERIKREHEARARDAQGLPMRSMSAEEVKSESSHESDYTDNASAKSRSKLNSSKRKGGKISLTDEKINVDTEMKD